MEETELKILKSLLRLAIIIVYNQHRMLGVASLPMELIDSQREALDEARRIRETV